MDNKEYDIEAVKKEINRIIKANKAPKIDFMDIYDNDGNLLHTVAHVKRSRVILFDNAEMELMEAFYAWCDEPPTPYYNKRIAPF